LPFEIPQSIQKIYVDDLREYDGEIWQPYRDKIEVKA